jgi:hypothetical protein
MCSKLRAKLNGSIRRDLPERVDSPLCRPNEWARYVGGLERIVACVPLELDEHLRYSRVSRS